MSRGSYAMLKPREFVHNKSETLSRTNRFAFLKKYRILSQGSNFNFCRNSLRVDTGVILGDTGATSRDDAIFLGVSLLQELKSPWELILTEPVP